MEDLRISSNWIYENEDSLKNLITYVQPDNKNYNLEHINPETCICLIRRGDASSDSKPELDIQLKYLIKELSVFSEGSLIEVFGVLDEYLFTCVPEFVDDWEGMAVYHAKIILPGIKTCKLKFKRIKEEGRLWLYSIQMSVITAEESCNHLFNFENVNKLISSSSQEISEKAQNFKKFFEFYTKNSSSSQSFSIQTLFNLINREWNVSLSDCSDCSSTNFVDGNESMRNECNKKNELSVESQFVKVYIDKKLLEVKEDLMKHIEKKFCELRDESNARLDHIIKLLENSKLRS